MAIRHYKIVLRTVGPVHVGNGDSYGKKDYFEIGRNGIAILDVPRFVQGLNANQLDEYCRFLNEDSSKGLQVLLDRNPKLKSHAKNCIRFQMGMSLAKARRGSLQRLEVFQCVKDAYDCPYVPGSSVKGMLRTAILTHIVQGDRAAYAGLYDSVVAQGKDRRRACRDIERKAFWRERPDSADSKVANDIMRWVSVSDSAPLSVQDLVFVKKYDKFSRADSGRHKKAMGSISKDSSYYEGNELNIYRECIKPGTAIELTLDVDDRINSYLDGLVLDREGLRSVLESSFELYNHCFLDFFSVKGGSSGGDSEGEAQDGVCRYVYSSGPFAGRRCRNRAVAGTCYCNTHKDQASPASGKSFCYIGGGVDFNSKTIVSALFGDRRACAFETSRILYAQFPTRLDPSIHPGLRDEVREAGFEPRPMRAEYSRGRLSKGKDDHRHWRDAELGVSPHTMKMGIIGNKKYPMGKCTFDIQEVS